jgi:NAD(P)-dependent dehydrogenase (short-subunit alcohol dehydrogenase family)
MADIDFSLEGKVAIITGAAGGIGQAYARTLGRAGAKLVVADIAADAIHTVGEEMSKDGLTATSFAVDIIDENSVQAMADHAKKTYGGIDILVNNAALMGGIPWEPLMDYPIDWWDKIMKVNCTGALICSQKSVPSMIERGGGKIINQSSAGAWSNQQTIYGISKLAVVALTIGLAKELGKHKINVNAIAPGMIQTPATIEMGIQFGPELEEQRMREVTALKAFAPPEDLCGALLFLASPASDYMTGQCLNVDGGWVYRF